MRKIIFFFSIFLIFACEDKENDVKNDWSMTINLMTKNRTGTSDVGEEFAKFISRYGVRFDRLD